METLPPLTPQDLKGPLENPTFSVYLYVGKGSETGWKNAELAFKLLPRLRIYLVRDLDLIEEWVDNRRPKGVVFGFGPEPKRLLNKGEAEDLRVVLEEIMDARGEE
jgi:hypothetical protein